MIKNLENVLMRRIGNVESSLSRFDEIAEQIEDLRVELKGKGAAKDPNEPTLTHDDIARWNKYEVTIAEQEEKIKQLQIELTMLDPGKVKHDISTLTKNQATFLPRENVARMEEDVKKIRMEIADNSYEVQAAKDMVTKTDKMQEAGFKDLKQSL